MAYLVLVRHGQTEWNALGLFSGSTDIPLNKLGEQQAREAAALLRDIAFDKAYTSKLSRAKVTLRHILHELEQEMLEVTEHYALNERSYGVFEGKDKRVVAEQLGAEKVRQIRRAWDTPIPEGETLKMVAERVVPFYEQHILKDLKNHKNIIVSSHSNVLRTLRKHLENLTEKEVEALSPESAEIIIYKITDDGQVISKM